VTRPCDGRCDKDRLLRQGPSISNVGHSVRRSGHIAAIEKVANLPYSSEIRKTGGGDGIKGYPKNIAGNRRSLRRRATRGEVSDPASDTRSRRNRPKPVARTRCHFVFIPAIFDFRLHDRAVRWLRGAWGPSSTFVHSAGISAFLIPRNKFRVATSAHSHRGGKPFGHDERILRVELGVFQSLPTERVSQKKPKQRPNKTQIAPKGDGKKKKTKKSRQKNGI